MIIIENEKIFELIEKMYIDLKSEINKLNGRFDNLEGKFDNLEGRFDNLEKKVDKNTLLLEKAQSDINLIAEVQQSFQEQLGRSNDNEGKSLNERLDIIELAVASTSRISNNNYEKLSDKIDNLQIDVNTLTAKTATTDSKVIQFERLLNKDKKQG